VGLIGAPTLPPMPAGDDRALPLGIIALAATCVVTGKNAHAIANVNPNRRDRSPNGAIFKMPGC
jgi:hypothetical protein